jgi:hypothetical protein
MNSRIVLLFMTILLCSCVDKSNTKPEIFLEKFSTEQLTQVEFYPSSFIFDTVDVEKEYERSFLIINKGNNILTIDSVLKSCNCTSVKSDKVFIAPKDTFEYRFKIRPYEKNNYFVSTLMFHMNTKPYYRQYIIEGFCR